MFGDINLIFFGFRVLLFSFFLALSIGKTPTQQALVVIPSVIYLILSMYVFLYPGRLKLFKNYGDLLFLPLLVFLSGQKEAMFALLVPIAFYTSRRVFKGILFLWLVVGFSFYHYGVWGLAFLSAFFALFIASLHPDLIESVRKERFYIRSLRTSYSMLAKEYARLEKHLQTTNRAEALLEELTKSKDLYEYLRNIKNRFELKSISITPINQKGSLKEPIIDMANSSFHIVVNLEKGSAKVSFFFENPMLLYDKELLKTLEKAGELINLYIEGFEEKTQAKVIAV